MNKRTVLVLTLTYVAISVFNFGALNADFKSHAFYCEVDTPREHSAVAALFSLLPIVGTTTAIFGTGFVQHGFDFKIGGCPTDVR